LIKQIRKNKRFISTEMNHKKAGAAGLCAREGAFGNSWRAGETEIMNRKVIDTGFKLAT
jgi:hypothetical protein